MPAMKCGGCAKFLSPLGAAKCSACKVLFHRVCGSLPSSGSVDASWSCPVCTDKGIETGTTSIDSASAIPCTAEETTEIAGFNNNVSTSITVMLKDFKKELRNELLQMFKEEFVTLKNDFLGELQKLRSDVAQLKSDGDQLRSRLDTMDTRMVLCEQKLPQSLEEIAQLRRDINDRDQLLLSTDIEISNLPEIHSEQLTHTVKLIGNKLGVNIEDRDIVSVDRIGGGRVNATSAAGAVEARPRAVIVRLARRDLRDELLRAARVRRGVTTADFGLPGPPRRFYLNERLTKLNRLLFRQAREAGQRLGWRFVWTKHGRVLARYKPDDQVSVIRQVSDIQRVFGPEPGKVPQK